VPDAHQHVSPRIIGGAQEKTRFASVAWTSPASGLSVATHLRSKQRHGGRWKLPFAKAPQALTLAPHGASQIPGRRTGFSERPLLRAATTLCGPFAIAARLNPGALGMPAAGWNPHQSPIWTCLWSVQPFLHQFFRSGERYVALPPHHFVRVDARRCPAIIG